MQFSVVAAMSFQKGRSSGRSSISARSPVSVSRDPALEDADVQRLVERAGSRRALAERLEAVQAEVVAAPLHVGGGERDAERLAQHRQVLEEDLLLQVLGAGRDEHALAAEDRRHEIGERLAGAGARFGEQHAAVGEDARRRPRPSRSWPARGSKPSSARGERDRPAAKTPRRRRRVSSAPLGTAGTSGTAPRLLPAPPPSAAIVVRRGERARR